MSPSSFARRVQDTLINNDIYGARQAYYEWQVGNCLHPQTIRVNDAHTQTVRTIQCACGRCYHCNETKINEWVTRMYAHLEDFKHVYFVTLTYRSFVDVTSPVSRLILDKLSQAVWHYDKLNFHHHASYNPCLLCKQHYQNFIKRLRKNTGYNDITYVLSGEYGTDYGRPHFHLILFSSHHITREDITRAWSVALFRRNDGSFEYARAQKRNGQKFYFPIGRIDYNDLVTNGTLNTTAKIRVDGSYLNASECFAYVCKYVCKRDKANLSRVKLAYYSLYHKRKFVKVYNNDIEWKHINEYLNSTGMVYYQISQLINNLKHYIYEKNVYEPTSLVYSKSLLRYCRKSLYGFSYDLQLLPDNYPEFRDMYCSFCEFSRGCPIGSIYAKRHLSEFKEDVYNKPLLQDRGFVVPAYFRRKASQSFYGLRVCRSTLRGRSVALGGLVDLRGRIEKSLRTGFSLFRSVPVVATDADYQAALQDPRYFMCDLRTGERILSDGFTCRRFRYNRRLRKYECTFVSPLCESLNQWLSDLSDELLRHRLQVARSELSAKYRENALSLLEECVDSRQNLRDGFERQTDAERHAMQELYNAQHKSVE